MTLVGIYVCAAKVSTSYKHSWTVKCRECRRLRHPPDADDNSTYNSSVPDLQSITVLLVPISDRGQLHWWGVPQCTPPVYTSYEILCLSMQYTVTHAGSRQGHTSYLFVVTYLLYNQLGLVVCSVESWKKARMQNLHRLVLDSLSSN